MKVECLDREGKCFAREQGQCRILNSPIVHCPFKKPERDVTNGVRYPFVNYSDRKSLEKNV